MHFDAVFNRLAAILLANLGGFLLHKRREAVETSRDALASLLLCFHQRPIKLEYLLVLGAHVGALHRKRSLFNGWCGGRCGSTRLPDSVNFVLGFMFLLAHALDRKQCILRPPVALFANSAFLAPQITINGITLRHFVVAKTLGETHAAAITEFAEQTENLPLDIRRRLLARIAKVNLVLDLQAPQDRDETDQYVVYGHLDFSSAKTRDLAQRLRC